MCPLGKVPFPPSLCSSEKWGPFLPVETVARVTDSVCEGTSPRWYSPCLEVSPNWGMGVGLEPPQVDDQEWPCRGRAGRGWQRAGRGRPLLAPHAGGSCAQLGPVSLPKDTPGQALFPSDSARCWALAATQPLGRSEPAPSRRKLQGLRTRLGPCSGKVRLESRTPRSFPPLWPQGTEQASRPQCALPAPLPPPTNTPSALMPLATNLGYVHLIVRNLPKPSLVLLRKYRLEDLFNLFLFYFCFFPPLRSSFQHRHGPAFE